MRSTNLLTYLLTYLLFHEVKSENWESVGTIVFLQLLNITGGIICIGIMTKML